MVVDRDGTLIRHVPYLSSPAGVEVLPTVADGLRLLRDRGIELVLHTNQSGVGRGWFSLDDVHACNQEMLRQLQLGDVFSTICVAREGPDDEPVYRKPSPRLGLELLRDRGLTPDALCYIGDNLSDLMTAANLGCHGIGVDTGGHDLHRVVPATPALSGFGVVDRFVDAARLALAVE